VNPKTVEFECCRLNLLPGIFKTLSANIGHTTMPLYLFEVGDVVILDSNTVVGSRNERRLAGVICHSTQTCLEFIHGTIDRLMQMNQFQFISQHDINTKYNGQWPNNQKYYSIKASDKPTFFPKRQAAILIDDKIVGYFGLIHPQVTKNFGICSINYVFVTAFELNIEPFL